MDMKLNDNTRANGFISSEIESFELTSGNVDDASAPIKGISLSISPKSSRDTGILGRGMEIARAILYPRIARNFHTLRAEEDKVKNMSKDAKRGFFVLGGAALATIACMVLGFMVG